MIFRFLIFIAIWLVIDLYVFQAVKTAFTGPKSQYIYLAYWLIDGLMILTLIYLGVSGKFASGPPKGGSYLMALAILSLAPKIVASPFLLIEDIFRLLHGGYLGIQKIRNTVDSESLTFWSRRKFVSQLALGAAAIPFVGTIYGVIKGKYDYRVHKVKIAFKDLPDAFHGFKITQLSDIHSGSFDDPIAVQRGIDLANAQNSDMIVFTGDLVNNLATEMDNWIGHFSELTAPLGKFSILGNHDYGDYVQWPNEEAKQRNFDALKNVHQQIGFRLLLNESVFIEKMVRKLL